MKLKAHVAADLFPMLDDADLAALAEDIREHGQRQPIVLLEGKILDGRNRYEACRLADVEPKTVEFRGSGDPVDFVISVNLKRRHLAPAQKAAVAASLVPIFEERNRLKMIEGGKAGGSKGGRGKKRGGDGSTPGVSRDDSARSTSQAAKTVGAGLGATKAFATIADAAPNVLDLAKRGKVNVRQAKTLAGMPKAKQEKAVEAIEAGAKPADVLPKPASKPRAAKPEPKAEAEETFAAPVPAVCGKCKTVRPADEIACANCDEIRAAKADADDSPESEEPNEDDGAFDDRDGQFVDAIEFSKIDRLMRDILDRCPRDTSIHSLLSVVVKWERIVEKACHEQRAEDHAQN